jgi:hypothetical protein
MADAKISALPASTTPLAGTEVLPIVQSSTTKQVSVANLTAGRAISATELTLTTGNLVIGTAGKGIDFSADPSLAGMTSELLDDYEEGTWTIEFRDATSGGNVSSTTFVGQYRKIGSVVHIWFNAANINDTGLTDANVLYFNLPFVGSVRGSSGACRTGALTYPVGTTVITPTASTSTYGWFFGSGTTVNSQTLTCGALSANSSDFTDVQITYLTT